MFPLGGDALCRHEGCLELEFCQPPDARLLGRQSGSATYRLWVWHVGLEARHWPLRLHAHPDIARRRVGRRLHGGGLLLSWWQVSVIRHSSSPGCPTIGRAARDGWPCCMGARSAALVARHPPRSARSWELALHAVAVATERPQRGGGAPSAFVRGVWRSTLILPRPLAHRSSSWGPLPTSPRCGVRAWRRDTSSLACMPLQTWRAARVATERFLPYTVAQSKNSGSNLLMKVHH